METHVKMCKLGLDEVDIDGGTELPISSKFCRVRTNLDVHIAGLAAVPICEFVDVLRSSFSLLPVICHVCV